MEEILITASICFGTTLFGLTLGFIFLQLQSKT